MMNNTGQSCNAPSRLLVHAEQLAEAEAIAAEACSTIVAGDPQDEGTVIGPIANGRQYQRVQSMIEKAWKKGLNWLPAAPASRRDWKPAISPAPLSSARSATP